MPCSRYIPPLATDAPGEGMRLRLLWGGGSGVGAGNRWTSQPLLGRTTGPQIQKAQRLSRAFGVNCVVSLRAVVFDHLPSARGAMRHLRR